MSDSCGWSEGSRQQWARTVVLAGWRAAPKRCDAAGVMIDRLSIVNQGRLWCVGRTSTAPGIGSNQNWANKYGKMAGFTQAYAIPQPSYHCLLSPCFSVSLSNARLQCARLQYSTRPMLIQYLHVFDVDISSDVSLM